VNYWQGNPTMTQVGPQTPQGPNPNIFQRAWQSLGHLFGAPHAGPGSAAAPYYGTPYQYGTPEYAQYWDTHWGAHVPRATLVTPTAHNPEQGQTLSGDDGSGDGSGAGLLSNNQSGGGNPMANLFQYIFHAGGGGSPGQPASFNDQSWYGGPAGQWPTGSQVMGTPGASGSYVMGPQGPNGEPGQILATDADTANPGGGGGGMGAGQMGSSAIGAIGSGISSIGKNISNTKSTYTAPNIPLPQKAYFAVPNLAPNTNA
jgi:hypothetical protein